MAKMTLELGGKYTAGEAFKKASDDVKAFGRQNKDAIKAGTDSLKELQKGFGEDVSNAVGKASSVVQGLATGGLWGALGAAAGWAIGAVVDWFKKAEENAKEFAKACGEYVTNNLKRVGEEFKSTTADISAAKQEIKDFAAISQGEIANAASAKVHNLHVQTLQKITDNMTEAARKVITANEALEAATIKQSAAVEMAAAKEKEQRKVIQNAQEKVEAAERQRSDIISEQNNLSIHENQVLKRYAQLKAEEEDITRRYKDNMLTTNHAAELHAKVQEELNEILEKNKGLIDSNAAAVAAATEAESAVKDAIRAKEHEERNLILVQQQNAEALRAAERAVMDATMARKEAIKAEQEYTQKTKEAAEKEAKRQAEKEAAEQKKKAAEEEAEKAKMRAMRLQILKEEWETKDIEITKLAYSAKADEARLIKIYHDARVEGLTQEEAMAKVQAALLEQKKYEKNITEIAHKYKLDEKEFLKEYNEMLKKGISETDAYAQVQKDLNDALKERKAAEKKAAEETLKSGEEAGKKKEKEISVTLSANAMGDIGEKVEEKLSFKDWQRKMRDEQRKVRDQKNNLKIDQAKMTKALKGEMPEEEAKQWMQYAKTKYTPDQMRELGKLAMNKELLSKSEQKRQLTAIEKMAREIALALATK